MLTTSIINDLHELTDEIQSLLDELNELAEKEGVMESLISYLK